MPYMPIPFPTDVLRAYVNHNLGLVPLPLKDPENTIRDITDPGTWEATHQPRVSLIPTESPICPPDYGVPSDSSSTLLPPCLLSNKDRLCAKDLYPMAYPY